jgi:putative tricarboxylic transport membrane protein
MLEGLLIGLETAFSLKNLFMVVGGCIIGTFIGMLPGLGPMSIIAIMIPVAITLGDPAAALILLAGVYYGAIFGGSTSSILLNAPVWLELLQPVLMATLWLEQGWRVKLLQ